MHEDDRADHVALKATDLQRHRRPTWLGGVLLVLLALLIAAASTLWWTLRSERGTAWLLSQLPGVEVLQPRGSLLGDFGAETLTVGFGSGGRVELQQLQWRGLTLGRSDAQGSWLRVVLDSVQARQLRLTLPKASEPQPKAPPPDHLRLPVEVEVRALHIHALHADALGAEPLRDLQARIHASADGGRLHRIESLSLAHGPLHAAGHVHVGAAAPMTTDVQIDLHQAPVAQLPEWNANLRLAGPLAHLQLQGGLSAQTTTSQSVNITAMLRPFDDWPLPRLDATAQSFDVAALLTSGPRTALSGQITLRADDGRGPARATAELVNAEPGSWDSGRLPLRRLELALDSDVRHPDQARLDRLQLEMGSSEEAAGRIVGGGQWSGSRGWSLDLALQGVRPERVQASAPPMHLDGTIKLAGSEGGSQRRGATLSAELLAKPIDVRTKEPIELKARAALAADRDALRVEVHELLATSAKSRAHAKGHASRDSAAAPWTIAATLALEDFDFAPWWPAMRTRRAGGSRIGAHADVQASVRPMAPGEALFPWLAALQGRADLRIARSTLAGVPLQGNASLRGDGGADGLQVSLQAEVAGNQVGGQGRLARDAARDQWQMTLAAPALQRLAPLLAVLQAPADARGGVASTVAGSVSGNVAADGRWPVVQTRGELMAQRVRWPGLDLRRADARWQLGTVHGAPLDATLSLSDLRLHDSAQARDVPALALKVDGTADAHRIGVDAEVASAPAEQADSAQRGASGTRTSVDLQARGALLRDANAAPAPTGWKGIIESAELRRAPNAEPLLRTGGVALDLRVAAPASVRLEPGRADVVGASLRWSRLSWQAAHAQAPMQIEGDLTLDPMRVAPLLARLQPMPGWSGDLEVSARAALRTAPAVQADVELVRRGGDLQLMRGDKPYALGLSELRLALRGDGAAWRANARVGGKQIGSASAEVQTTAAPQSPWPAVQSPLQGTLVLRLADLAVYESLLPVGWRLGGTVQADARIAGKLGAPEFSGDVRGSELAVSNFVEGVRVRDGELRASLNGERGHIERFEARAGDGSLRIEGGATFGAQPTAQFDVVAERFRALGRVDRTLDLSGRAQVRMQQQRVAVQGALAVDEGLIDLGRSEAPALTPDVRVVDGPTPGRPDAQAKRTKTKQPLDLDVRVDLGQKLRVRGKGIDTLLAGDLRVTAPAGQVAVNGTVRTEKGRYDAYGQKLDIDRGLITFIGPVDNPRLDIRAIRTDLRDVEVGVAITGSAQNPRVRLFSTPEMSELDRLSWLTMGRSSVGLASDQSALLQRAAMAMLAGEGGGGDEGIAKRLGLDKISVSRGDSGGVGDAVVSLGKQVSERFYVGYQQSLDAAGGGVELIYKLARSFMLRVQTGGATAVDAIWTWLWG